MTDTITLDPAPVSAPPAAVDPGEVAQLRAVVAELLVSKQASEQAAEAAALAKMSDAERNEAERKQWRAEVDNDRAKLRADRKTLALEKLGVASKFFGMSPEVDASTPDGQAALEKWVQQYPELVTTKAKPMQPTDVPEGSALHKVLTGALINPFMSRAGFARLLGR